MKFIELISETGTIIFVNPMSIAVFYDAGKSTRIRFVGGSIGRKDYIDVKETTLEVREMLEDIF